MDELQQKAVCDQYGAEFLPSGPGSRVGIAIETLGLRPLNGLRLDPANGVCGWYLWGGGEPSKADDFYKPVCVEHVADHCPAAIPFLALPPGWRFLTDGDYVDVWFDALLTEGRQPKH
ncbi:hypothetical protein R5W24_002760 [Gemmata sp. JC717]|uniref:immunity protein Imm33 domain-containing protein n=1 Tax=Gemmata algarum TaxID=2975278 RepID=UPI0021BADFE8|nr:hypothetical protein [Gemmata algarum]MDY3553655.1 hypothetical protein [Gemmata algarum]